MSPKAVGQELAERVVEIGHADIPDDVIEAARLRVIDATSCMLQGSTTPSARQARRLAQTLGGEGPCSVVGSAQRLTPDGAALANAVAAHALELDDAHARSSVQPGAAVVSTALSLAEANGSSGTAFLRAVVSGYEVSLALGDWLAPEHKLLGFHPTATLTTIGATATACSLLAIDEETTRQSLLLATSAASGLLEFARSTGDVNHLHVGQAVRQGGFALQAARTGFTGAETAFEGPWGLAEVLGGHRERSWPGSNQWRIREVASKPYPSCRLTHTAVDVAARLRARLTSRERLGDVVVKVSPQAVLQTDAAHPRSLRERQFSTQFGVAVALTTERVAAEDFLDDARAGRFLPLAAKVRLEIDESLEPSARAATVVVRLEDGAELNETALLPAGEPTTGSVRTVLESRVDCLSPGLFDVLDGVLEDLSSERAPMTDLLDTLAHAAASPR